MIWILGALLCVLVIRGLRSRELRTNEALVSLIHEENLKDLERERESAYLTARQAKRLAFEGKRRLRQSTEPSFAHGSSKGMSRVLSVVIPVAALSLYLGLGRPDLPSRPYQFPEVPPLMSQALERVRQELETTSGSVEEWTLLARAYARLDRSSDSLSAWRRALDYAKEDDTETLNEFGQTLVRLSRGRVTEHARRVFEAVLSQDAENPYALFFIGLADLQIGEWESAMVRWERVIQTSPADAPWMEMVTRAFVRTNADLNLDRAVPVPLDPERPPLPFVPPFDPQGRIEALERHLSRHPQDIRGWIWLSRIYRDQGLIDKQGESLYAAYEQAGDDVEVLSAYAGYLFDRSRELTPELIVLGERIRALEPYHPQGLWLSGLEYAAQEQGLQAQQAWTRAIIQLDPESAAFRAIEVRLNALP